MPHTNITFKNFWLSSPSSFDFLDELHRPGVGRRPVGACPSPVEAAIDAQRDLSEEYAAQAPGEGELGRQAAGGEQIAALVVGERHRHPFSPT